MRALPTHGSRFSKHVFTQSLLFALLFALLTLKPFWKTDYRGLATRLAEWRELRRASQQRETVLRMLTPERDMPSRNCTADISRRPSARVASGTTLPD